LGLATQLGKSHTSSVIGTPEFMAPGKKIGILKKKKKKIF
jgi:hypothetical protein